MSPPTSDSRAKSSLGISAWSIEYEDGLETEVMPMKMRQHDRCQTCLVTVRHAVKEQRNVVSRHLTSNPPGTRRHGWHFRKRSLGSILVSSTRLKRRSAEVVGRTCELTYANGTMQYQIVDPGHAPSTENENGFRQAFRMRVEADTRTPSHRSPLSPMIVLREHAAGAVSKRCPRRARS